MKSVSMLVSALLLVICSIAADKTNEVSTADLVKQHLNSIGNEQARAAVKTRVVQGVVRFRVLSGGTSEHMRWAAAPEGSEQMGKETFVSEGSKLVALLKLPNPSYHGERFATDGRMNSVAQMMPGIFSDFGEFVHVHDEILTEGLWGGALSTGWALAHLEDRHAKLQYKGLKKIDGRELHRVEYVPAKRSDLEIELYFEPVTFRHVMTTYSMTVSPQIARSDVKTARQQPTRYVLEEQFINLKPIDDLQLPGRWIIRFTTNVPRNPNNPFGPDLKPFSVEFDTVPTSISHNVPLDPKNFEIK